MKNLLPPISSYFDLPAPKQPTTKQVQFEDVKDFDAPKLQNLHSELGKELKSYAERTNASYVCQANMQLISALLADSTSWDAPIYNAWKDTGFKVVGCPEFVCWVEHDLVRNRDDPSKAIAFSESLKDMYVNRQLAFDRLEYGEHVMEWQMMNLVVKGARLTIIGSDTRKSLLKFASTGKMEDAKTFFSFLGNPLAQPFRIFNDLFAKPLSLSKTSETGFALTWLYIKYNHAKIHNDNAQGYMEFDNDLLKDDQSLEEVYKKWNEFVEKKGKDSCMKALKELTKEHLVSQRLDNVEQEHKNFRENEEWEKVKLDVTKGKFGLFMAFRAYVEFRNYWDNLKISDLKKIAWSLFRVRPLPSLSEFAKLPHDDPFTRHLTFTLYYSALRYEETWKSWSGILESMQAEAKEDILSWSKLSAINTMKNLLEVCKPGGRCKIDFPSKKFLCSHDGTNEISYNYITKCEDKEEARKFKALLHEVMQCNSVEKSIAYVSEVRQRMLNKMAQRLVPGIHPEFVDVAYEFGLLDAHMLFYDHSAFFLKDILRV